MFDVLSSLLLLMLSPIVILFQDDKIGLYGNIVSVLFGFKSWVGYGKDSYEHLPVIRPSVLSPVDAIKNFTINEDTRSRLHLAYSKDYRIQNDVNIVWKAIRKLGN